MLKQSPEIICQISMKAGNTSLIHSRNIVSNTILIKHVFKKNPEIICQILIKVNNTGLIHVRNILNETSRNYLSEFNKSE